MDKVDTVLRAIMADVLGLGEDRAAALTDESELFGALPEFDSMSVAVVLTELEDRLGIIIDDEDVDGELFATFGNLLRFCRAKLAA
ncbi:MAG: acyl carrier protein [Sphingopyxis sp.]|nr:acyl carrier protein [Sphingopyxis sp.]